jgi:hypothetical protein
MLVGAVEYVSTVDVLECLLARFLEYTWLCGEASTGEEVGEVLVLVLGATKGRSNLDVPCRRITNWLSQGCDRCIAYHRRDIALRCHGGDCVVGV